MTLRRMFLVCIVLGTLVFGPAWATEVVDPADGGMGAAPSGADRAAPDLICSLAPQPASGQPAPMWYWFQTIQFQMLVKNVGDAASDWCHVGFYVGDSPDDYSTWVDVQDCQPLDPDDETIINIWITFPEGSPSWVWVNAHIDYLNEVAESDETNNKCAGGSWPVDPPEEDLIVEAVEISPPSPVEGDEVQTRAKVVNIGWQQAHWSDTGFWLDGMPKCEKDTGILEHNEYYWTDWCNLGTVSAGDHVVQACADVDNDLNEGDETNNCTDLPFYVPPSSKPDLQVLAVEIQPAAPGCSDAVQARAQVGNTGEASAAASQTAISLNGSPACTLPVSSLAVGASAWTDWCDLGVPGEGAHTVEACADSPGEIVESDETNNCTSEGFVITCSTGALSFPAGLNFSRGATGIEILVQGANGSDLDGYSINFTFDPAVFEPVAITLESTRGEGAVGADLTLDEGLARCDVVYSLACPPAIAAGEGSLLKVVLNVRADAPLGPTPLDLEDDPPALNRFSLCGGVLSTPDLLDGEVQITDPATVMFTDVTAQFHLEGDPGTVTTYGVCWVDYQQDGDLDLYAVQTGQPNLLFRNLLDHGEIAFQECADDVGLADVDYGEGAAFVDMDNDGDQDLFLCRFNHGVELYRNDNGTYQAITAEAGINPGVEAQSAAWADYDLDGDLDLFVGNHDGLDLLYRNEGGPIPTFTDVAATMGVQGPAEGQGRRSHSMSWADYDNDGWPDLLIATYGTDNRLYHNLAGVGFEEVAAIEGVLLPEWSYCSTWGDCNNDGLLDLFVSDSENGVNARLYLNEGSGFVPVDPSCLPPHEERSGSGVWGDYDNDGDLDLYLTYWTGTNANELYRNLGGACFEPVGVTSGTAGPGRGVSAVWGDYDNDGDLDLYVGSQHDEDNTLYRNNCDECENWVDLRLVGTVSNRDGVGARVRVCCGETCQMREVNGNCEKNTQNARWCHFGVGATAIVDSLVVFWPASGITDVLCGVAAPSTWMVVEGGGFQDAPDPPETERRLQVQLAQNPVRDRVALQLSLQVAGRVRVEAFDASGRRIGRLYDRELAVGSHRITCDPAGWQALGRSEGIAFLRVETPDGVRTRKVLRLR